MHIETDTSNGFTGLFISLALMLFSNTAPDLAIVYNSVLTPNNEFHFPPWVMEGSQLLAWWCVGGTFCIAVLNYFNIKLNPFKKKEKQ